MNNLSDDPIQITDNDGKTLFDGPFVEARAFVHNRAADQFPVFVQVRFQDEAEPRTYRFGAPGELN